MCDRASFPGSDAVHLDGGHRPLQGQADHPADGACPGSVRTGCCPDGQRAEVRPGSRGARDSRGRLEACPGSARTGCCPDVVRLGGAPGERRQEQPRAQQAPRACQRRGCRWPDEREISGRALGRPQQGPRAHSPKPPQEPQPEVREPQGHPLLKQPQRGRERPPTSWLRASSRRPCPPRQNPRRRTARRGTSRESCGRRAARWSKTPTGRTRRFPSNA